MKNLLVVVALLGACGPKTPVAAAPVEASAAEAMLPPPYDPATVRRGFEVGTVIRYKLTGEAVGVVFQEWAVTAADKTGCTVHIKGFAADGVTVTDEEDHEMTWTMLSAQGEFPASITTRTESSIDFAGQPLATLYYEQVNADGASFKTHFAPTLPGPPVWVEMRAGGGGGGITMEMLSYAPR